MGKFAIVICMLLLWTGLSYAEGRGWTSKEYPWVMRSVAALGMGDAYYAKSDSKYAPFYNPAGLARINGRNKVHVLPVSLSYNENIWKFYDEFQDIDTDNDAEVAEFLAKRIGKFQHADVSLYPSYTRKYFTVGLFGNVQANGIAGNHVLPELNVDVTADMGIVMGVAQEFLQDKLQAGIAARFQKRYSYDRSYTVADIAAGEFDDIDWDIMEEGYGVFFDVGVIYNFYNEGINPRIGFAVNNIGTNGMGDAKDLPYSANLSFGISPSYSVFTTDLIIDIRDITQNFDEDYDWGKRINLGAEIKIKNIFAIRTGLHQGYATVGAGVDLHYFTLDYAYYREEVGAYSGQKSDARHAFELVAGF